MIKGLKTGRADGVIMHKIDRSARNLRDWLELADLIDSGHAVHFVNENIDLRSRGGRLSADIQAVIAVDYIRYLREETRKGIYGRLKQGVYPFCAPPGYKNSGPGGKLKRIDEVRAPFIRQAFELYASGRYTLDTLLGPLRRRGVRNSRRRPVLRSSLALILNNPFYAGIIRIRTTGESFNGKHEPLITMSLFKRVEARLAGKLRMKGLTHDFALRGLFRCALCGRHLTAERQKGHVYYRCHTASCPTLGFREEVLEDALLKSRAPAVLTGKKRDSLIAHLTYILEEDSAREDARAAHLETQIASVETRLARVIDALLDGALDKESFEMRKRLLLEEEQSLKESQRATAPDLGRFQARLSEFFELACTAQQSYRLASPESKREMALRLTSNRTVAAKDVSVEPYFPLAFIEQCSSIHRSGHQQHRVRTAQHLVLHLWEWAKHDEFVPGGLGGSLTYSLSQVREPAHEDGHTGSVQRRTQTKHARRISAAAPGSRQHVVHTGYIDISRASHSTYAPLRCCEKGLTCRKTVAGHSAHEPHSAHKPVKTSSRTSLAHDLHHCSSPPRTTEFTVAVSCLS